MVPFEQDDLSDRSRISATEQWTNYARLHLKAELKKADATCKELANRLAAMGLAATLGVIAMKVSRGAYPAWFLFAVMSASDRKNVYLNDRVESPI